MKHNIPGFFVEMKGKIIDGMSGCMEDEEEFDAAYTRQDIDRCDEILMTFLAGLKSEEHDITEEWREW